MCYFFLYSFDIIDSSIQALACEHIQFNFSNIHQLPCFGVCTNSTYPITLLLIRWELLIERSCVMCVKVVHHQCNFFCIFVLGGDFFYKASPFQSSSSFSDLYHALPCQWFTGKENVGFAATLVFIIVFSRSSRRCRDGTLVSEISCFGDSSCI